MIAGKEAHPGDPRSQKRTPPKEAQSSSRLTRRIAVGIEYCGRLYNGWQWQNGSPSVQKKLTQALSEVAATSLRLHGAGRTDTGVHAITQVAHFDTRARRSQRDWVLGANARLPEDIRILWAREMPDDFHARHSALRRNYRYLVHNASIRSALYAGRLTWEPRRLDLENMRAAAGHLEGRHDFTSFRAASCGARNPWRTVYTLQVWMVGELFIMEVEANAFLQRMVRNIAGTLLEIGLGRRAPGWSAEVLAARDRRCAARTAPADGLYLAHIDYPAHFDLPWSASRPILPLPLSVLSEVAGGK